MIELIIIIIVLSYILRKIRKEDNEKIQKYDD